MLRQNADKVGFYRVSRIQKVRSNMKRNELVVIMESRPHPVKYLIDEDWEAVYEEVKEFVQRSVDLGMFAKASLITDVYGERKYGDHETVVPMSGYDIEHSHSSDEDDDEDDDE